MSGTAVLAIATFVIAIPGAIHDVWQLHAKWKESGRQMDRAAAMSALKLAAWLLLMCIGVAVLWTGSNKRAKQITASSIQQASTASGTSSGMPVPDPSHNPPRSVTHPKIVRPERPAPASSVSVAPLAVPSPQQSLPNSSVQIGSDNNSQTMVNSPGGMQAKGDIVNIGKLAAPPRVLLPNDIAQAKQILSMSKGSIAIVSFPTNVPDDSEIFKFTDALTYALSQGNWNVWRARGSEYYVGTYNGRGDMPYGPHGVGCSIPNPSSDEAKTAVKALAALKLYCRGPSVMSWEGENNPFTVYITVGTRIVPEE